MRCEPHGLTSPCPLCERGAWPTRDLMAVVDFAGKPMEDGIMPNAVTISLSEIVRSIGRRWVEVARVRAILLKPLYTAKNALVREARFGPIDVGRLEKAAEAVARGETRHDDPVVHAYIQTIVEDQSTW